MQGSGVEADLTLEICPNTKVATIRWNNNFTSFVPWAHPTLLIFEEKDKKISLFIFFKQ